jgi:hypothetical protein
LICLRLGPERDVSARRREIVKGYITGPHCKKGISGQPLLSIDATYNYQHIDGFPSESLLSHAGSDC